VALVTEPTLGREGRVLHNRAIHVLPQGRIAASPIPIHPSKRDLVMLASGVWPCYFHNHASRVNARAAAHLAIYLDVSGSVNEHLPKILGVLRSLRNELTTIFQFSNKVVETSFETLLKGNIHTTYGITPKA